MLYDQRDDVVTVCQTSENTLPEHMTRIVDVVVSQTDMLNVGEVGEKAASRVDGALLEEVVEVSGACEDKSAPRPEHWLCFGVDALTDCQDVELVVPEVHREGADWVVDLAFGRDFV